MLPRQAVLLRGTSMLVSQPPPSAVDAVEHVWPTPPLYRVCRCRARMTMTADRARADNRMFSHLIHPTLYRWITSAGCTARVALASSGVYSFDLALALYIAPGSR